MDTQSKYTGLVTLKFFDKDGNLKTTAQAHNRGTPYLFSVLSSILERGTESRNDYRPGKIMLTDQGTFTIDDNSISYNSPTELRTLIPQVSVQTNLETPLYDSDDSLIIDPCVRYEFNISSYDLNIEGGITNLDRHRFWLVSANESQFQPMPIILNKDNGDISDDDSSDAKMNFLLDRITWKNVIKDDLKKAPKICAEVQLIDTNDDVDYSLNKGEYVSVLWDMHFSNNENN